MPIFISHSKKDEIIVECFLENILINGMGVPKNNIFCTSIQGMDIKSGEDFKERIKKEITSADIIIQIISDNYKESEICLNEMGAAWVLGALVIPFILPPISFSNVGFIHNTTQLLRLNERDHLSKFRNDHINTFATSPLDEDQYNKCIDSFFKTLSPFEQPVNFYSKKELPKQVFDDYFNRFLDPDINHYNLMIKAQPNLADCKAVFKDHIFEDVYAIYSILYRGVLIKDNKWEDMYTKDFFDYDLLQFDEDKLSNNKTSAGLRRLEITKLFKPKVNLYSIHFKNNGAEYGVAFYGWVYINKRWVFFPKPWRFLRSIEDVNSSRTLKTLYRWLKIFGVHKSIKEEGHALEFLVIQLINKLKKE